MALPYKLPIPADALAAAVPTAFTLLHFVRLGAIELSAGEPSAGEPSAGEPSAGELSAVEPFTGEPFPNELSAPFDGLPDPFCAGPPVLFESSKVDSSCIGLTAPVLVTTAAACVTVTVY